jgi:metalloprotein, YbeY/UPF0054 family
MNIEIFNETDEELSKELKELKDFLIYAANHEKLDNIEYNVIIIDNPKIRELNRSYRNIDKETDVISFALEDDKTYNSKEVRLLGDIYISIDKAREQANLYEHSFKRELFFLAIHGFLHLLGFNHEDPEEENIMFAKQEEVLNKYGISR